MANFPDGTPRPSAPTGDGDLRHAAGTAPPPEGFGWLDKIPGVIGGPNRAANNPGVNIGPSSSHWRRPQKAKYTLGDQKKR